MKLRFAIYEKAKCYYLQIIVKWFQMRPKWLYYQLLLTVEATLPIDVENCDLCFCA